MTDKILEVRIGGKRYLTAAGVAAQTGRTLATVHYWASQMHGSERLKPAIHLGRQPLYQPEAAERFFAHKRRGRPSGGTKPSGASKPSKPDAR